MNSIPNQVIDSHQHFWQLSRGDYDWLTQDLAPLYKDFLPNDFLNIDKRWHVSKTILVQAAATNEETDFLLQLAEEHSFIAGVVGWVQMESDSSTVCRRLEQLSQNKTFKGIRPMLQDTDDPDWILNPKFHPIFEKLVELNLTFDALINEQHLLNILELAKKYPDLPIVIDHCAKPNIANEELDSWSVKLENFKDKYNVFIKVSGLTTEASITQQSLAHYIPYFSHVEKVFGANRMMWGSDWPVVNINSSYQQWQNLVSLLTHNWDEKNCQSLFVDTATNFYRIEA